MRHVFEHNLGTANPFVDVYRVDSETDELIPFFPAITFHPTIHETVLHLPPGPTYLVSIHNYDVTPPSRWTRWVSGFPLPPLDNPAQTE